MDVLYNISVWWTTEVTWTWWFAVIVYAIQLLLCIYGNNLTKRIPFYFWVGNAILWLITFPFLLEKWLYPLSALQLYYVLVIIVAYATNKAISKIMRNMSRKPQKK